MSRRCLIIIVFISLITALSACADTVEQSLLIGQWESEHTAISFNLDGSGHEDIDGQTFPFLWHESEGLLIFDFTNDAEGSLFNDLMGRILHGAPIESFGFSFSENNQVLTIADDHGHGHFQIILRRV